MKKRILIPILLATSLFANSFNEGINYYQKGDYDNASKAFLKSANNGNLEASYILGYFYTGGLGVKQSLKESLSWYEKAANGGHVKAQINLGFMYIGGQGTKVDYKKAAHWIKKAKDAKHPKAQLLWDQFKLEEYWEN